MINIPVTIDDEIIDRVEKELMDLVLTFKAEEKKTLKIHVKDIPEGYAPIGKSASQLVLPLRTTTSDGFPLAFKVNYGKGEYESAFTPPHLMGFSFDKGYRKRNGQDQITNPIEFNTAILKTVGLDLPILFHVMADPFRNIKDYQGNLGNLGGYIVPDVSNRGQIKVRDLRTLEKEGVSYEIFNPAYMKILELMKKYDIRLPKTHSSTSLETAVKHMLFHVAAQDPFLVVGDVDHFRFNYGKCSHCGQEGPIMKSS